MLHFRSHVTLQISKGEIHLPDQFQQTFDGSFTMYPPRLQLTIEGYAGERPTIDLECSLDVKGTVEPCCFTLKMKAPPASEGTACTTSQTCLFYELTVPQTLCEELHRNEAMGRVRTECGRAVSTVEFRTGSLCGFQTLHFSTAQTV